jgi:hypothetical protein
MPRYRHRARLPDDLAGQHVRFPAAVAELLDVLLRAAVAGFHLDGEAVKRRVGYLLRRQANADKLSHRRSEIVQSDRLHACP